MTIRPTRSAADYDEALGEIDRLMGAAPGTPESDKLEILVTLARRQAHTSLDNTTHSQGGT